eukprot:671116-Alexandrium_andersonii.AAC.1
MPLEDSSGAPPPTAASSIRARRVLRSRPPCLCALLKIRLHFAVHFREGRSAGANPRATAHLRKGPLREPRQWPKDPTQKAACAGPSCLRGAPQRG